MENFIFRAVALASPVSFFLTYKTKIVINSNVKQAAEILRKVCID